VLLFCCPALQVGTQDVTLSALAPVWADTLAQLLLGLGEPAPLLVHDGVQDELVRCAALDWLALPKP
jgi:hypothetical protein